MYCCDDMGGTPAWCYDGALELEEAFSQGEGGASRVLGVMLGGEVTEVTGTKISGLGE